MMFTALLLALAPAPSAGSDTQASPIAPLYGLWDGTVGNLPIRACFGQRGRGEPYGIYFYRSKLITIPLIKDDKGAYLFSEGWSDDAKAPRWEVAPTGPNAIAGSWKQGARTLPLRLTRVPIANDEDACESVEFQQPRLEGIRIVRSPAVKDGVRYTKLALDDLGHFSEGLTVESFELAGNGPATDRINSELRKRFDQKDDEGWLSCFRYAGPWGGDHHETIEPRMISRRWLVVNRHWGGFCGGAHPDSSNTAQTFDLTTGREINIHDWFNDRAIKRTRYEGNPDVFETMQPELRKLVIGGWKGDEECAGTIDEEEWWNIELGRTGFTFTPSLAHVVQACEESFHIPFARLAPYFTPEGRKNVAALRAEGAPGR